MNPNGTSGGGANSSRATSSTVDVDDLPAHLDGGVEDLPQHAHALEDLQGARLDADGLGVLRRFEQLVDDAAGDTAAAQLDRGGQTDRSSSGDENVSGGHGRSRSFGGHKRGCPDDDGGVRVASAGDWPGPPANRILSAPCRTR